MRGKNAFKRAQDSSIKNLSNHALIDKLFREMLRCLNKSDYIFKNKTSYSVGDFFKAKSECLGKVTSISLYLIDTLDMDVDPEMGKIFTDMYSYVYHNSKIANQKVDIEAVYRARLMVTKLIEVWDLIPESHRT